MEEKIEALYGQLEEISRDYLRFQEKSNIERVKKKMPHIQEFALWFLEGNKFGIEQELYQGMSENLLEILKDIVRATEQGDRVLMHDAAAYGLMEYLRLFLESGKEEQKDDAL